MLGGNPEACGLTSVLICGSARAACGVWNAGIDVGLLCEFQSGLSGLLDYCPLDAIP